MAPVAVVKVGTSSIAKESGELDDDALAKLAADVAAARGGGHDVVLVMSGAIAAGMPALGLTTSADRHRHAAGDRGGRPAAVCWNA